MGHAIGVDRGALGFDGWMLAAGPGFGGSTLLWPRSPLVHAVGMLADDAVSYAQEARKKIGRLRLPLFRHDTVRRDSAGPSDHLH